MASTETGPSAQLPLTLELGSCILTNTVSVEESTGPHKWVLLPPWCHHLTTGTRVQGTVPLQCPLEKNGKSSPGPLPISGIAPTSPASTRGPLSLPVLKRVFDKSKKGKADVTDRRGQSQEEKLRNPWQVRQAGPHA